MKIALIQMTSGPDIAANQSYLTDKIREAAKAGAVFIATPENSDYMVDDKQSAAALSMEEAAHPYLPHFKNLARELNVWILLGSIKIKASDEKRYNRSYLLSPSGGVAASYNKIHLFDVTLPSGEVRQESQGVMAGDKAVIVDTDFGKVGMTVCYDVRFPHLYRKLAQAGAGILTVPAAFTVSTGEMHWEVLLRARAIENGAFVIAPAQCGTHDGGRKTYGHSMVVDPWGKILAKAGDTPTILYADIDKQEIARFRQAIPSLSHDREII
jgi:predicted amidohydrolase